MKKVVRKPLLKQQRQKLGIGRTVGAFIIGATAGSALALLFAPASGQVTRRRIGLKFRTLQRQASRQLRVTQRLLAAQAEHLKEAAATRMNHAREWVVGHVANGSTAPTSRKTVRHA